MTAEEKADLKQKILELIEKYDLDIQETEENTSAIGPDNALGRVSRMDAINNKSVMEASLRNKISKRNKLKLALSKIDNEGFGKCERCGCNINPARLMYMPESSRCIRCADKN